MDPDPNDIMP